MASRAKVERFYVGGAARVVFKINDQRVLSDDVLNRAAGVTTQPPHHNLTADFARRNQRRVRAV